jgi:hypothetical protein
MDTFLVTLLVFGIVMLAMSVGVIVSNKKIQGSCGGGNVGGSCDFCDNPCDKAQKA